MENISIKQKTPLRVLHRRAPLIRDKVIHKIYLHPLNENYFVCLLMTSAGTYVKEFIHSDLERTLPNLGTLLKCEADIL